MNQKKVVVVGGGTAGMSVLAGLARALGPQNLVLIEPSQYHFYQPWWTLVGAGITKKEDSRRLNADFVPKGVEWIQEKAVSFEPEQNQVTTVSGRTVNYDYLVVAPGIQLNWDKIAGLPDAIGKDGVCSNYSYDTVDSTWKFMREFKGGTAIFTMPNTPVKCAGAPQKVMWLAEEQFRINGVRDKSEVIFATAGAAMFGVMKYRLALEKIAEKRNIKRLFKHNLIAIDAKNKIATFENLDTKEQITQKYDMLHVTPPMSAPDFIAKSPLADTAGWVDVDKFTLQHNRFKNVFGIGDASSLPTSRTGAAVRSQGPVLIKNLLAHIKGETLDAKYDGYASCPMITSRSKCMMIEFDYDGNPKETFPFDQSKERRSMFFVKRHVIPFMYWKAMLKGFF